MTSHNYRSRLLLAGAAILAAVGSAPASADPLAASNMGGGFIELLMTGRNPGRPAPRQAMPQEQDLAPQMAPQVYHGGRTPAYAPAFLSAAQSL